MIREPRPQKIAIRVRVRKGLGAVDPSFCRAIANGQILQSQVDIQTLYECSQAGIVGVQASPASVVAAASNNTLPAYTQASAPPPASLPAPVTVTQYLQADGTWSSAPPVAQQIGPTPQVKVTPWNPPAASSNPPAPAPSSPSSSSSSSSKQQQNSSSPTTNSTPPANDPNQDSNAGGDQNVLGTDAEHAFKLSDIPAQIESKVKALWAKAESIAPWYVWAGAGAALLLVLTSERKKRRRK